MLKKIGAVTLALALLAACSTEGGSGPFSRTKSGLWISGLASGHYSTYRIYLTSATYGSRPAAYSNPVGVSSSNAEFELFTANADGTGASSTKWLESGEYYVHISDSSGEAAVSAGQIAFTWGDGSAAASVFRGTRGFTLNGLSSNNHYGDYRLYLSTQSSDSGYSTSPSGIAQLDIAYNTTANPTVYEDVNETSRWYGTGAFYAYLENDEDELVARTTTPVTAVWGNITFSASDFKGLGLKINDVDEESYGEFLVLASTEDAYPEGTFYSSRINITGSSVTISAFSILSGGQDYYLYFVQNDVVKMKGSVDNFKWGTGSIDYSSLEQVETPDPEPEPEPEGETEDETD